MQTIIQFILDYKEYIIGAIVVIAGLIIGGRKKAIKSVEDFFKKEEASLVQHLEKDPSGCAKFIYNVIPLKFKLFISVRTVEKVIVALVKILDKKQL